MLPPIDPCLQPGASGGQFTLAIVGIVVGIYLMASIVNKSNVLMTWGLTFPQQIFFPIFRNDLPK